MASHCFTADQNCAALPASLAEAELFGHQAGALTGSDRLRRGRFELADGGTIFLDEVSELPPEVQAKLLRVLQDGQFERVGSAESLRADVRVIAATNRNLSVLKAVAWRISGPRGAAKILGLNPSTLRFRMKKHGISKNS